MADEELTGWDGDEAAVVARSPRQPTAETPAADAINLTALRRDMPEEEGSTADIRGADGIEHTCAAAQSPKNSDGPQKARLGCRVTRFAVVA